MADKELTKEENKIINKAIESSNDIFKYDQIMYVEFITGLFTNMLNNLKESGAHLAIEKVKHSVQKDTGYDLI